MRIAPSRQAGKPDVDPRLLAEAVRLLREGARRGCRLCAQQLRLLRERYGEVAA